MAGRPRIEIDEKKLLKYCDILCTQEEIAYLMDCSVDTIDRWCKREKKCNFAEYYKKGCIGGKESLRRAMFKTALGDEENKPNVTLLIWLSKQHLNMTDQPVDESRKETYQEPESLKSDD